MMKKNMMEKTIKAMAISAAMVMACGTMTGCGNSDAAKAVQAAGSQNVRTEARVPGLSESDLKGLVEGLEDHYVLENAKGVDYLYGVKYDKEKGIVKSVEADSAKVDLSKPGKYEVIYTVTVDEQFASEQAKSADVEKSADTDTEVEVKKEIEVVDEEKAKELAAKGEEVWTDNNEVLPKAEESADAETANAGEESAQTQAGSEEKTEGAKAQASHKEAGSASAANNTPSAKPQVQSAHTHTWVTVEATGHYEEQVVQAAWDEPVYGGAYVCNQCGYTTTNDESVITHSCQYGHSYHTDRVQTGTTHHPAVTQSVWVQDSAAYQRCSVCGATK